MSATAERALLQVLKVSKSFGFPALSEVDCHVNPGERLGLIGPNGSGKTTLINCITGAQAVDAGTITLAGTNITMLPGHRRARLGVARTFQIPQPFKSMSLLQNLVVPMRFGTPGSPRRAGIEERAREILRLVGLDDKADRMPTELTQIEMRKLELARALSLQPKLLLLDEVLAGLSTAEVDQILVLLKQVNAQGIAVIMIEHIMRAVMSFCERIVVLNAGMKIADGLPEAVMRIPEVEKAYLGE